jgi:hypothetical protein
MRISEEQYFGLIDRVVHEGAPELLIGPTDELPVGLPPLWANVLSVPDPRAAIAHLWNPMEDRLPRVCRALRERLQGVGLLCTDEVPASLVYFFSDGDYLFHYRGRQPRPQAQCSEASLPAEFLEFYHIHDGWVLFISDDDGPEPWSGWLSLQSLWTEVDFKLPPGEVSLDALTTVFRDGDELVLAYDTSALPSLPFICRNDGTVEPLLDMWAAIDRLIGEFLEELDLAASVEKNNYLITDGERKAMDRWDILLKQLTEWSTPGTQFEGSAWHEQACDLLLQRAWLEKRDGSSEEKVTEFHRQALHQWGASLENGGQTSPQEVLDMFALALAVSEMATAGFVATLPPSIWSNNSLEALQVQLLLDMFCGDFRQAESNVQRLLGMTFDEQKPVHPQTEIVARLLESLYEKNRSNFIVWRQRAFDTLVSHSNESNALIPWRTKLIAFDVVASRLNLTA